jgi:hypothetical protein
MYFKIGTVSAAKPKSEPKNEKPKRTDELTILRQNGTGQRLKHFEKRVF